MKKIILVSLIMGFLSGCAIFRTTDVTISNNSDHNAYVSVMEFRRNGDFAGSSGGSDYIELLPHTAKTYKLYDKGSVELTKPNRNFLKKNSNKLYEVLNSPKKIIKVFNKTGEKITLSEANNLFDEITLFKDDIKDIEVFTVSNFIPCAINEQKIVLKTIFHTYPTSMLVVSF